MNPQKPSYPKYINVFYHLTIIIISLIVIVSICPADAWASSIYIDPGCKYNGDGSFNYGKCSSGEGEPGPYNTWSNINFSASNDYRQKCGTAYYGGLKITESGTSYDHIIIGAYSDNGGKPVHEDDDPSFGRLCGNSAQKPIIKQKLGSGNLFLTDKGKVSQYLEINSIQFRDADVAIYIKSNYNEIRYCYFYNLLWGIRIGISGDGDYNTIEFNYFDLNDTVDEDREGFDPIKLQGLANHNTIQYNHITGFDHIGILAGGADNNTIQYNYIFGDLGNEDVCLGTNPQANGNIWRYNYCKDAGLGFQFGGGDNNEVYGNVFTCNGSGQPFSNFGCIHFYSYTTSNWTSDNNKLYNNVIYDHDNNTGSEYGIKIVSGVEDTASISGNQIFNNIIQKVGDYCIRVVDNASPGVIDDNYYKHNSCYDYRSNQYASIEGSTYATAESFNVRSDAEKNRDDNPGLKNPSAEQFWPESESANVVGNGRNLGLNYNKILDYANTDFKASPPKIKTEVQPVDWYIGAYALGARKKMNPPPQEVRGFHALRKKPDSNGPIDSQATAETKTLYNNLKSIARDPTKVIFGHHSTTWHTISADQNINTSDPKNMTGSHSALVGTDYIWTEWTPVAMKNHIEGTYNRGGVNEMLWHARNPITGGFSNDTTPAVPDIIPGGSKHDDYKNILDGLADFVMSLRGSDGNLVPVIFRPYHEHNGSWYWWGRNHCTVSEFKTLWQFTVEYLRDTKNVHNLLYAYSPDKWQLNTDADYLERYPGDSYVDILGIDVYYYTGSSIVITNTRRVVRLAEERDKIPALTESGHTGGLVPYTGTTWFTQSFMNPVKNDTSANRIAYAQFWWNTEINVYYVPYPGEKNEADFMTFFNDPFTLFEDDLPNMYTYP